MLVRAWMGSIRYRWCGPGLDFPSPHGEGNCVYVLWHQRLLAFTYTHRAQNVRALISSHGDGEMISRVVERLGFKPIRGSSTRGGMTAMRELLSEGGRGLDYAIMPDGPRGPCYEFKPGAIFLASRIGIPIVPISISFARWWSFRSWDRFVLPCPFTRAVIQIGAEIHLPTGLSAEDVERRQREIGETLRDLTDDTDRRFEELYRSSGPFRRRRLS